MTVAAKLREAAKTSTHKSPAGARAGVRAAARGRGRPARLSRELVVEAVVAMLDREPIELLTIARIAKEVEAVPAALYRHFDSLDDLLDSVLATVLATVLAAPDGDADSSASWQARLASWMHGLRARLLRYPAVLPLIGRSDRTSPAWLEASSSLVEILAQAGLGGRELATSYLWILEMTVGLAMQEAMMPLPAQLANARASHGELSEAARARFAPILSEMQGLDGDALFASVVERVSTLVALATRAPTESRRTRS